MKNELIINAHGDVKTIYPPLPELRQETAPAPLTFKDSMEWNKHFQQERAREVPFLREYAAVKREPEGTNRIYVINFSDLHFGHADCDYDLMQSMIDTVEYTPNTYCVLGWNILDMAIPAQFPDGLMWSGQTAMGQVYSFREKIRELADKDKILAAIGDSQCHEGWCLSADTEILTKDGWKKDVEVGEEIVTLNRFTEEFEYMPVLDKYRGKYEGKMRNIKNDNVDLLSTPNHRILYQYLIANGKYTTRFHEARFLDSLKAVRVWQTAPFPNREDGNVRVGDNMIKLIAWIVTEGTLNKNRITIYQSLKANPKYCERIRKILHALPISFTEAMFKSGYTGKKDVLGFIVKPTKEWLEKWFPDGEIHRIPRKIFSLRSDKTRMFIHELMLGDGNLRDYSFATKRWELASNVQELAIKSNLKATIYKRNGGKNGEMFDVSIKRASKNYIYLNKASLTDENYNGEVWCPLTKNETVVVRRNGKVCVTGNSKKKAGWMVYKTLFEGIDDVPLLLNGGYLDIQTGGESYRTALFHKTRYYSTLNRTHSGQRAMDRLSDAEIVFTSHFHQAEVGRGIRYNPPFSKEVAVVASGTCKLKDKWLRGNVGEEGTPAGQGIMLWADKHKFEVVFDFNIGKELILDAIKDEEMKKLQALRKELASLT